MNIPASFRSLQGQLKRKVWISLAGATCAGAVMAATENIPVGLHSGVAALSAATGDLGETGAGVLSANADAFSGSLSSSIPLKLPPGTKQLFPLSLSYNSRRGNGHLGVGWGLDLPVISISGPGRAGETVSYTFSGGGESVELARVSGNEYQARIEKGFLKFFLRTDSSNSTSWEIINKQGVRFLLGAEEVSTLKGVNQQTRVWLFSRAEDTVGNQNVASYAKPSASEAPLLKSLTFTNSKAATDIPRSFSFSYEPRKDAIPAIAPGTLSALVQRMSSVATTVGGNLYETLVLSYEDRAFGKATAAASLLKGIQLQPSKADATPLTVGAFKYGEPKDALEVAELGSEPFAFGSTSDQCLFGNFRGNGKTGMICRLPNGSWWEVESDGSGMRSIALKLDTVNRPGNCGGSFA